MGSLYSEMLLKVAHSEYNMKMDFFIEMRIIYSYTENALILKLCCFSCFGNPGPQTHKVSNLPLSYNPVTFFLLPVCTLKNLIMLGADAFPDVFGEAVWILVCLLHFLW